MSTLKRAIELGRRGYPEKACDILRDLTRTNADDICAWLWLAEYSSNDDEVLRAAQRVLELRPTHVRAQEILDTVAPAVSVPLDEVIVAEKPKRRDKFLPQNPHDRWMVGLMVILLLLLVAAVVLIFFGLALSMHEVAFWALSF